MAEQIAGHSVLVQFHIPPVHVLKNNEKLEIDEGENATFDVVFVKKMLCRFHF